MATDRARQAAEKHVWFVPFAYDPSYYLKKLVIRETKKSYRMFDGAGNEQWYSKRSFYHRFFEHEYDAAKFVWTKASIEAEGFRRRAARKQEDADRMWAVMWGDAR